MMYTEQWLCVHGMFTDRHPSIDPDKCVFWEVQKYSRRTELDLLPRSVGYLSLVVSLVGERLINQKHGIAEISNGLTNHQPTMPEICDGLTNQQAGIPITCDELTNQQAGIPIICDELTNQQAGIPMICDELTNHESMIPDVGISLVTQPLKALLDQSMNIPRTSIPQIIKKSRRPSAISTEISHKKLKKRHKSDSKKRATSKSETENGLRLKKVGSKKATCKEVSCKDRAMPSSRWGHSMTPLTPHSAIVIGGQGEKRQLCKDAIWMLDTETRKWRPSGVTIEGQRPEMRLGHTATFDPLLRCVYVYGGIKKTKWLLDVHMLDLDNMSWSVIKTSDKSPTRAYHSTTLHRHELWVFGGTFPRPDPQPDGCSNDVCVFSPVDQLWYHPVVNGNKPLPRSGHSATMFGDQMVIFGGWDFPVCYSELFILDICKLEWTQPETVGSAPKPRSWHGAASLTSNRLLIHGGYDGNVPLDDTHILSMGTLTWTQIRVDNSPPARAGHSIISLPYSRDKGKNDEIMVFGGGDNDDSYFKDVFSLMVPFHPKIVKTKPTNDSRNALSELTKLKARPNETDDVKC